MKKNFKAIISAAAVSALAISAVPFSASAEGDVVYGTMDIPYAEFYAAELAGSANAYDVDAVSSATATKWSGNGLGSFDEEGKWTNGGLVAGTYNDGAGTILGITYPVAITESDLNALGAANYNFTKYEDQTEPGAYKTVTVTDGAASFSAIQDSTPESGEGSAEAATESKYGDYQLQVTGFPTDCDIYGVIIKTTDGNAYALRNLENIWRNGQLAWSVGFKTTEGHGNTLSYENFVSSIGKTINEIEYITTNGIYTVTGVNTYLPVKFDYQISVEDGIAGSGATTYTLTGVPSDFAQTPSIAENFSPAASTINYTNALPGSYTLTIADGNGKYADIVTSFLLTTDSTPASFNGTDAIVAAEGVSEDDFANYIKNISSVSVNGTSYNTGRKGTTIIKEDGTIDFEASSRDKAVFDGSGNYTIEITSTGYTAPLTFAIGNTEQPTDAPSETDAPVGSGDNTTTTAAPATTKDSGKGTTITAKTGTDSPKTGVATAAAPAAVLALAVGAAVAFRKKND